MSTEDARQLWHVKFSNKPQIYLTINRKLSKSKVKISLCDTENINRNGKKKYIFKKQFK